MNKKDYKKLLEELINKSFPSLKNKNIYIYSFSLPKKHGGGMLWALPFWRIIFINKKREFTKKQLVGLLSHELCHFEIFQKKSWLNFCFRGILYWVFSKRRKKEERAVENLLIKKGYAREAYNLAKTRDLKKKIPKYYLSPNEIKLYAQKIGKW